MLSYTTCLEIGPELPVLETRHGIYCALCYSITCADHRGVGRSMKADNDGLYPIRSKAIISEITDKLRRSQVFLEDVYDFRISCQVRRLWAEARPVTVSRRIRNGYLAIESLPHYREKPGYEARAETWIHTFSIWNIYRNCSNTNATHRPRI